MKCGLRSNDFLPTLFLYCEGHHALPWRARREGEGMVLRSMGRHLGAVCRIAALAPPISDGLTRSLYDELGRGNRRLCTALDQDSQLGSGLVVAPLQPAARPRAFAECRSSGRPVVYLPSAAPPASLGWLGIPPGNVTLIPPDATLINFLRTRR